VGIAVLFPREKAKLLKDLAMSDCRDALEKVSRAAIAVLSCFSHL
jgi:hypothetical protein